MFGCDSRNSPIEWIEQQHVLAGAEAFRNVNDVRLFLGGHRAQPSAMIERLDDDFVGDDIQLLLHFALHVHVIGGAQDVGKAGAAHLVRDHLSGERHVVQDSRQFTRGFREIAFLLDDEPLDRDD